MGDCYGSFDEQRLFSVKHATKSHLSKLISRAGRSDISGPEKVSVHSTADVTL